jgi:hypothetical protein
MKEKRIKPRKKATREVRSPDDLAPNYDFDYSKAKPNRFARSKKDQMVILLDKEFTKVFRSPDEVTNALRSLIHAIPPNLRRGQKAA